MVRTGIATNETIKEVLENNGQSLTYGATPEAWRDALTAISGEDETITPRETEHVTGWMSTNETVLKTFNNETKGETYTVDVIFLRDGKPIRVSKPTLNDVAGTMEDDHYEFAGLTGELKDVDLKYTVGTEEVTVKKSYSGYTDDIEIVTKDGAEAAPVTVTAPRANTKAYGMKASDYQKNVKIDGNKVTGVCPYVEDFKGLPEENPEKKKGNFLSLHIEEAALGYTVTCQPEGGSVTTLDKENTDVLYRLVNKKPITITVKSETEPESVRVLDISDVILESKAE